VSHKTTLLGTQMGQLRQ